MAANRVRDEGACKVNNHTGKLSGVLAAAATPLTADGENLDEAAFSPLVEFLVESGLAGMLALGTTGEGILLDREERRRCLKCFVEAARRRFAVIAHCGAQTTRDTAALAQHAAEVGADAVAVIAPPYFVLDDSSILNHFVAAARACAPLPFFVYEFAARSGYSIPINLIAELRTKVDNLAGLKVSDPTWKEAEPYLIDGLSVFVGQERLIAQALANGATGAVSALATALPELVIDAVNSGSSEASEQCFAVRSLIQRFPFHSALKTVLRERGVMMTNGVRSPLRPLTRAEHAEFVGLVPDLVSAADRSRAKLAGG